MTGAKIGSDHKSREDLPEVRFFLRVFLGFFGGLFVGIVSFLLCWYSFDPRLSSETPAAIAGLFGFVLGAIAIAFASFARNPVLRVLSWAVGGAGFGNVLLALVAGGLSVGTFLTPSGVVLAIVGGVLGYRTVPPRPC